MGRLPSIIAAASLLSVSAGCSTLPLRSVDNVGEGMFQAAHLVDAIQTYRGPASDPCYIEVDPMTSRLIGAKPSHAGVIAWAAGFGALHYGITRLLLDHDHDYVAAVWEAVTIAGTADSVGQNIRIGVRLGSRNRDPAECHEREFAVRR